MKNPKGSGSKGPSLKTPPSSSGGGNRKSRWETDAKSPAHRPGPSSDPKLSTKPKVPPSSEPPVGAPKDRPTSPHGPPPVPSAGPRHFPHPDHPDHPGPPPPPSYGFHNLERRTIVLADGSVRSYFALPPDDPVADKFLYGRPGFGHGPEPLPRLWFDKHFPPPPGGRLSPEDFRQPPPFGRGPGPQRDYWDSLGLDGPRGLPEGGVGPSSMKRKYGEEDEFLRHRHHLMHSGNPSGTPLGPTGSSGDRRDFFRSSPPGRDHHDELRSSKQVKLGAENHESPARRVDGAPPMTWSVQTQALRRAFLKFVKMINENPLQRKKYLDDGKSGALQCVACGRASKDVTDMHGLIMHTYNSQNAELRVDHLGLHKALCVLMGWDYSKAPDNSKAYQLLSADDAQANREDLIIWPPTIIVHNTSRKRKDGRIEGMGNKDMDYRLQELGFGTGKARSIHGKDGHTGIMMVKFPNTQVGLKEAERLAEYFEKDNHGRKAWARVQASQSGDDEKKAALVLVDEKTGGNKRVLYGYLATVSDLDVVDADLRRKAVIKSRRDFDLSD